MTCEAHTSSSVFSLPHISVDKGRRARVWLEEVSQGGESLESGALQILPAWRSLLLRTARMDVLAPRKEVAGGGEIDGGEVHIREVAAAVPGWSCLPCRGTGPR
jgi:hypothetical protein